MTCVEAMDRLSDLRSLKKIYKRLVNDVNSKLYSAKELKFMINNVDEEIHRIVDLLTNMELEDSYDQNTGEVNNIYDLKEYR